MMAFAVLELQGHIERFCELCSRHVFHAYCTGADLWTVHVSCHAHVHGHTYVCVPCMRVEVPAHRVKKSAGLHAQTQSAYLAG